MVFTEKTFDKCLSNLDELNAILLLGQNFGLATILGDKIKQTFLPEETIIIDYQDCDKNFGSLLFGMLGNDFFSKKKLIKIFNFKGKIGNDLKFINEDKFKDKLIIFFAPEIDSKSATKAFFEKGDLTASIICYNDELKIAIDVINNYCSKNELKMEQNAILQLAEMLHGDRRVLINELEKMSLMYVDNTTQITTDDINDIVETEQEFNPSTMIDCILSGDMTSANNEFELLKKDDIQMISIVKMFEKSLINIAEMKQMINSGMTIDEVIRAKFIFFKRIPFVKKILTTINEKKIDMYFQYLKQVEKFAKIYGNEIARSYFERCFLVK